MKILFQTTQQVEIHKKVGVPRAGGQWLRLDDSSNDQKKKKYLGTLAICLKITESDIRPGCNFCLVKGVEEGALFAAKNRFTKFSATLFCAWETKIRANMFKLKRFLKRQRTRKLF